MLKARLRSFKYAINGIVDLFANTPNAKIHLVVSLIVVICSFYFDITRGEWIAIIFCIGLVLAAESLNTSIELICALTASIIGCYIFFPYVFAQFIG